jgi:hypothetical protein
VDALRGDNHPPLYFFLLRLWRTALGDDEAATRSLSVIASLAGLLLLFDTTRTLHGTASALWAALLMGVAGPSVRFAQEARGYALAVSLVIAAAAALARLERDGPGRLRATALGLAALLAMLTHYYAFGALAGLALHALFGLRGGARRQALIALAVAGAVYAVTWGPRLVEQSSYVLLNNAWVYAHGSDAHGTATLMRLASMPMQFLVGPGFFVTPDMPWAALAYPLLLVAAWRRPGLRLFAFWALGAIGLVAAIDAGLGTLQLNAMRYVLPAGPAVWALLGACEVPRRWRRAVPVVALALVVLFLPAAYRSAKPGWRDYARVVDRAVRPGEIIAMTYGENGARWAFQALVHYAWSPSRAFMMLSERPTPRQIETLRARGACWLLTGNQAGPDVLIPGATVEERIEYPSRAPMPLIWRLSFPPRAATKTEATEAQSNERNPIR